MSGEKVHETSTLPRIKIRMENLSDLVFGLALSIGSLELLANTPKTPEDLETGVALFAFGFFIIVSIWIGYARIIAVAPQETGASIALNLLLLFCVVLEPYLFFVLQSPAASADLSLLDWTSFAYALDVGANFLILGALIRVFLRGKTDLQPAMIRRFRTSTLFYTIIGGLYALSALPIFWIETPIGRLRFVFWYSSFAFIFIGVLNRRRERTNRSN